MSMQILVQLILAVVCGSVALADQVILHWSPEGPPKAAEGIMVWVRDDGTLLADSGLLTTDQFLETCEEWRRRGTEPALRFILFPKLNSNLDLGVIWPLMSGLKEKNVGFELFIADSEDDPMDDLITKKDAEQAGNHQPITRPESK